MVPTIFNPRVTCARALPLSQNDVVYGGNRTTTRFNVLLVLLSMLGRSARHELQLLLVVNLQREISQHLRRGGGGSGGGGGGGGSHDGGFRRRFRRGRGGGRVNVGGRGWLELDGRDHGRHERGDRSRYGEELRLVLKRRRLGNDEESARGRNDGV
ncbi:hypothetical protein CR513_53456, partial [Mucuna pruriens]